MNQGEIDKQEKIKTVFRVAKLIKGILIIGLGLLLLIVRGNIL